MNEKFVTEAIQNDRCLKAARLLDQFEDELQAEIKRVGEQIVEENENLFVGDAGSNFSAGFNASTILANARDNIAMYRVNPDKRDKTQNLNLSLRWVDPLDWGEEDVDGALCAACYKINNGHPADFSKVKQETVDGDWAVNFGDDQYNNAPGLIYCPVETAEEFRDGLEEIRKHFAAFGDHWGVTPEETVESDHPDDAD